MWGKQNNPNAENNINDLVVVGFTTDYCVSTSVRMASNLSLSLILISDTTATFNRHSYDVKFYSAEKKHQVNLTSLNEEFCQVINTQFLLKQSYFSLSRNH